MSDEFMPLNAPLVMKPGAKPAPINWFKRVAPRLPEVAKPPLSVQHGDPLEGEGVFRAAFQDVDQIAIEERRRQQLGDPEPPEVTLLREQAREEAKTVIGEALEQARYIEQEARTQGYAIGYNEGFQQGEQDARNQTHQLAAQQRANLRADVEMFLSQVEEERQRAWAEMEPQVIEMVFELARMVIKQEVEVSRTIALAVIRNALRRVSDLGTIRLRVSPEDLDKVRSSREEILAIMDGVRHIEIIEDRRVGKGGCIVETDSGSMDARIETQLQMIGDTLSRAVLEREAEAA